MKTQHIIIIVAVVILLLVFFFRTTITSWFTSNTTTSTTSSNPLASLFNTVKSAVTGGPNYSLSMTQGSTGPEVTQLQTWLNGLIAEWNPILQAPLTVSGTFDSATASALSITIQSLSTEAYSNGSTPGTVNYDTSGNITLNDFVTLAENAGYINIQANDYTNTPAPITYNMYANT